MVPAAFVDDEIAALIPLLEPGDVLIDGGNSHYHDDIRRSGELEPRGIHYLDVGTSGGVWGLNRGYCLMVGGQTEAVTLLTPVFESLAPGEDASPPPRAASNVRAPPRPTAGCTAGPVGPGTS